MHSRTGFFVSLLQLSVRQIKTSGKIDSKYINWAIYLNIKGGGGGIWTVKL